ncbi:MAG TPA: hypothetical protein VFJ49_12400 [Methyloceanibacter sp.]|nr:hypothetical protein [Methyloceanibacter sp.]
MPDFGAVFQPKGNGTGLPATAFGTFPGGGNGLCGMRLAMGAVLSGAIWDGEPDA